MNSIQLLREQFNNAHETLEATIADVSYETAHFREIGKALPVGAAYAHAVLGEDIVLSTMIAGKKPLFTDPKVAGISEAMPDMAHWDEHAMWAQNVKVDLPKLRSFAKRVYKETDKYIASLSEKDLDREIDMGSMGKKSVAWIMSAFLLLHLANLTGEISSVKGVQGLKGYPF